MAALVHPALEQFLACLGPEQAVAQVWIRRRPRGYELCHLADRDLPPQTLRPVPVSELWQLARFTEAGVFRPLKSAPNLQHGWQTRVADGFELESALNQLYPGVIADWFAARTEPAPVTPYREFTRRQTGLYRVTAELDDHQAARVIRACCHRRFCLKQRLWTAAGLPPDPPAEKSLLACLEPCAVLLEFARESLSFEPASGSGPASPGPSVAALQESLETALTHPDPGLAEADFSVPTNPRRLQWLLEGAEAAATADTPPDTGA